MDILHLAAPCRNVPVTFTLDGMTLLVLLPGMDGTGELFRAFVNAVRLDTQIIRYPTDRALGYTELEQLVLSELPPEEPYLLLGESFSGPIALSIAARRPPSLRGVVSCCSFARNPRPGLAPLRALVNWLPDRPPIDPLMWFLAGRFSTPELREALSRALAQVSPSALRARLTAVIGVDVVATLHSISVPLMYLRASEDRVVPAAASEIILDNVPGSRAEELVGPHFLLQTRPKEVAKLVEEFMQAVEHAI
ncbi:alpha/beta fold hydrolase [Ramlibacter cellulosilyticus]|nr:alpha/beta hydrolase [Ramlibacter cellulosilyticus]